MCYWSKYVAADEILLLSSFIRPLVLNSTRNTKSFILFLLSPVKVFLFQNTLYNISMNEAHILRCVYPIVHEHFTMNTSSCSLYDNLAFWTVICSLYFRKRIEYLQHADYTRLNPVLWLNIRVLFLYTVVTTNWLSMNYLETIRSIRT